MTSFPPGLRGGALLCVLALALPLAQARELAPIDALGDAPLALQRKAAPAAPARVEHLAREERLGVPTFVRLRPAALPIGQAGAKAAADPASAARAELKALAGLYGLTAQEVDAARVHHVQALPGGGQLVRLTQQRDGIEVFREHATVLLNAQAQATAIGGYLAGTAPAPAAKAAPAAPLDAPGAVARALQDWGFAPEAALPLHEVPPPSQASSTGPYRWWALPAGVAGADGATLARPARAKPVWFRLPQGLVGAYYVEVLVLEGGEEHAYAYVVGADDGRLLLRHSQTAHAHSYRVWAEPTPPYTPLPGAQGRNGVPHPTGTADGYGAPLAASNLVTLDNAPFTRNDPWLPGGATRTEGNNVRAFANLLGTGWGPVDSDECAGPLASDFRACVTAPDTFDHSYDPARPPLDDRQQAAASVVNLFYTTNWLHDWFYDVGFDEAAGNAQADNFGRGGLGGDAMDAQALDFSGTNNANMYTPADGAPPRMRMYRFVNVGTQAAVSAPAAVEGNYAAAPASFGPQTFDLTGTVVAAEPADGCSAPTNAAALTGRIALVVRGNCEFAAKALHAQDAGAAALVVVNNAAGAPGRMGAGAVGGSVTIPALHVAQTAGAAWQAHAPVTLRMRAILSERSSALDNAVIAHEWGHFISNRLIGDANGLTTNHARGLGEGWGDFHALLLMAAAQDINVFSNSNWNGAYAVGGYASAAGQAADAANIALYGMRRYPYSSDMNKNPLTLRHIVDGAPLPAMPPRNPEGGGSNAQVHNMGEVWASMLWEFYTALLRAYPFQTAQDRMKRYLVAGYKMTPVNPTLIEARDALLAVVDNPADYVRGASAFARRGAGAFAQVPDRYSDTNAGVVESFSTSAALVVEDARLSMVDPAAQRCDTDEHLDSGETGVLSFTVRNRGYSYSDPLQMTLSSDITGVLFPDGATVTVPSLNPNSTAVVTARVRVLNLNTPTRARITATLAAQPEQPGGFLAQATLDLPLHRDVRPNRLKTDDAEATPVAMTFGSDVPGLAGAWAVRRVAPQDHRYAGSSQEAIGSHWMRTPPLQVNSAGHFRVTFRHRYRFEQSDANYDGGQLMISADGGATWSSVSASAAGYNGVIDGNSGNPAEGQQAYVGASPGWPAMVEQTVNLGTTYAGQTVQLAWVIHSDPSVTADGWEVDDIALAGIANSPFPQVTADAQACSPGLVATDGTPQSAPVHTAFGWPLTVTLRDVIGALVVGQTVTFAAPPSGASAALSATTAVTDAAGRATVLATANATVGSYVVSAAAPGYAATFALTNLAGPAPTFVTVVSGSAQSAQTNAAFAQGLRVRVLDQDGLPMSGVPVTYAAPASGASAVLAGATATTDANGEAVMAATANGAAGAYQVSATAGGQVVTFALTNVWPVAQAVLPVAGAHQSAPVNAAFAQPLRVRVVDANGNPLAGVPVAFAAPVSGASATLSGASASTDSAGEASVTATANALQGSYAVTVTSLGQTVDLALRNTAAPVGTGTGGGGGAGALQISGASPHGQGTVVATVQSALGTQAYFSSATFGTASASGAPDMPGFNFPFGLMGFALENVGVGSSVTLRIRYPAAVPPGAEYWKYGRTTPAGAAHWHRIPMTVVSSDTVEIVLTEGGPGDSDGSADGTLTDPGGLRVAAVAPGGATAIPALSPAGLALLTAALGLLGWHRRRRS